MPTETQTTSPTRTKLWWTPQEMAALPTVYRPDLMKGHVALVSGAGSGIGRTTAFLLARLGADVMICGRNPDKLQQTASGIKDAFGTNVALKSMTIRDPEQVEQLIEECFQKFGKLDTLINNGGGQFPQNAIDFSIKGWNAVIDTNLNGTWYMMQSAAKAWQARQQTGNIINIVAAVERGLPQIAHACAARAGVIYLSKSVAVEWAPLKIRVNCIAPGSIATEGFAQYKEESWGRFKDANVMRQFGEPWDIAEGVVYFSAASGKFITGEMLVIDGGQQMWGNLWPAGVPDYFNVV